MAYTYKDRGLVKEGPCPNCSPLGATFDRIGKLWECRNCGHFLKGKSRHSKRYTGDSLSPSQRKAIIKILNFYRSRNKWSEGISVRVQRKTTEYGTVSLIVKTRLDGRSRSYAGLMLEEYAHIFVGLRGGIKVMHAESGTSDETDHVSTMLKSRYTRY